MISNNQFQFLISKNHFLISKNRFSDIRKWFFDIRKSIFWYQKMDRIFWYQEFEFLISKNHFLISEIGILDIKKSFSDIRKYLKNIKTAPHRWDHIIRLIQWYRVKIPLISFHWMRHSLFSTQHAPWTVLCQSSVQFHALSLY